MKKALLLLKIAFSAALIYFLARRFSLAEAATHLLHLRPGPTLLAFLLLGVSLGLSGLRWHHASGGVISLSACLRFTWIAQLYALILPGALSADVAKGVVMTAKKESTCGRSLSTSIIWDRVAGLGSLLVLGLFSCLARPGLLPISSTAVITLGSLGAVGLLYLPWIVARLFPRFAFATRTWLVVLGLSVAIHAVNITFYSISLSAVGGDESWWQMGIYTCLLNLAMLLPVSIGGIGLREQIAVSLFKSSANAPVQIAFGWLVLFLSILHGLIGLAFHWQKAPEPSGKSAE